MNTLVNLFATGRIVIYILALLVVEGVVLILAARVAGKSIRPLDLIISLLAGAGLLPASMHVSGCIPEPRIGS